MMQFYKKLVLVFTILAIPYLSSGQQFKVVAYLSNWGNFTGDANAIDYNKVTHVNIAFINPINTAGDLGPVNSLSNVVSIIHSNNVKVLASMGGAAPTSYLTTLLQPANRTAFVTKIVKFVDDYQLDGIDVDFEGSAVDANYGGFVKQLSDSLKKRNKLLTAAVGTWYGNKINNLTLTLFDFVNLMSYDAYGTWTGAGEHSPYQFAVNDIAYWKNKGLTKDQIIVGLPFYGYQWAANGASSSLSYCDILSVYPRAATKDTIWTPTGGFISYNGVPTIKQKTSLAYEQGGGVMFWTINMDCSTTNPNSLLLAINQTVNALSGNIAPTVTLTSPADGATFTEGDAITLTANASDADGTISMVAFYVGTTKIGQATTAPYSIQWIPESGTFDIHARALDNVPVTSYSDTISITVAPTTVQKPYGGTAWNIPGKIEAENFDIGNGLGYSDNDVQNKGSQYRSTAVDIEMCNDTGGGFNVGYISPGEWLEYSTDVVKDSLYDIEIRYASNFAGGGQMSIELDGTNVTGNVNLSTTNGWQTWKTFKVSKVRLYQGVQEMKINLLGGEFNLNYVKFSYNNPYTAIFGGSNYNKNLSIYPNPIENQSTLKVTIETQGMADISILDLTGKEIMVLPSQNFNQGDNYINIDGSGLKTGLYLCKVLYNGQVSTIAFNKN